ncbi:hypothetical protein AB4305_10355 [Nocardia sp. 2YAB30]|uniref:hypothetical protein n=1 Tax=unclassified Nocardia TaxID=2637762 RepID=UPI003F944025
MSERSERTMDAAERSFARAGAERQRGAGMSERGERAIGTARIAHADDERSEEKA